MKDLYNILKESIMDDTEEDFDKKIIRRKPRRRRTDGVYGTSIRKISHGEWSDPELTDGKHKVNYWDVMDTLWDEFKEETGKDSYDEFDKWMEDQPNKDRLEEIFAEMI